MQHMDPTVFAHHTKTCVGSPCEPRGGEGRSSSSSGARPGR